jgi:hypothetical protein
MRLVADVATVVALADTAGLITPPSLKDVVLMRRILVLLTVGALQLAMGDVCQRAREEARRAEIARDRWREQTGG